MTYRVPAAKKSKDQDKFEITIEVDEKGKTVEKTFHLKSMKNVKPAVVAAAETMGAVSGSQYIINSIAPGLFELFEDGEQFNDFMTAWQEWSGVSVGESSASSNS